MLRNVIARPDRRHGEVFANGPPAYRPWASSCMPGDNEETMEKTIQLALELTRSWRTSCSPPFPARPYDMIQQGSEVFADKWSDFAIHEQKARCTSTAPTAW